MGLAATIIISLVTGIAASATFFLLTLQIRPKIRISPYLAVYHDTAGKAHTVIKFINRSRRDVLRVDATFWSVRIENGSHGVVYPQERLFRHNIDFLKGYRRHEERDGLFAQRLEIEGDIRQLWTDDTRSFLTLVIVGTDSVTGFSRAIQHEFKTRNALKYGRHQTGRSLEVDELPLPQAAVPALALFPKPSTDDPDPI